MPAFDQGTHPLAPLTPKEAADLIGVSPRTLERWRMQKHGPRYRVHRGRAWYRREWIDEFLNSVFAPNNGKSRRASNGSPFVRS